MSSARPSGSRGVFGAVAFTLLLVFVGSFFVLHRAERREIEAEALAAARTRLGVAAALDRIAEGKTDGWTAAFAAPGAEGHELSLPPDGRAAPADEWETRALRQLRDGAREVWTIEADGVALRLRFMGPLDGNGAGRPAAGASARPIRALSIVVPIEKLRTHLGGRMRGTALVLTALLAAGLASVGVAGRLVRSRELEREKAERSLRESEENLRIFMDFTSDWEVWIDPSGKTVLVSPSCEPICGRTPDEFLADPDLMTSLVLPGDREIWLRHLEHRSAAEPAYPGLETVQVRIAHRDGRVRQIEHACRPIHAPGRGFLGWRASNRDVTRRLETEAGLNRREALLEAVSLAAETFLRPGGWPGEVDRALAGIGRAAEASRVYIFENRMLETGEGSTSQRHEWCCDPSLAQADNTDLQDVGFNDPAFARWAKVLGARGSIHGLVRDFPAAERELLGSQGILSILVVPIFVEDRWWGFIGFDECRAERVWDQGEQRILETSARILAASIERLEAEAALQAAHTRLSTLIASLEAGTLLADERGRVVLANERFLSLFVGAGSPDGLRGGDAEAAARAPAKHFAEPEAFERRIRDLLRARESCSGEGLLLADGRAFERDYVPIRAGDQDLGSLWLYRDVTDRRAAEDGLRSEQARLRMILDHAPIGIWLLHVDGRLRFVNRAFCQAVGIPEERFLAAPHYSDLFDEETAATCRASDEAAYASCGPVQSRERILFADGIRHELETTKIRLAGEDGRAAGLIGLSLDLTERQRAERALRESEERFRSIAERMNDLVFLADAEGVLSYVSPAADRLFGFRPAEMAGHDVLEFVDPSAAGPARDLLANARRPGFQGDVVLRMRRRNGSTFLAEIRGTHWPGDGAPGALGIVRDVSERSGLEARLRQAAKVESVGRLAGGVAHDFNNLLQVILLRATAALEDEQAPAALRLDLEAIRDATQRSAGLTAQLLAFARKQAITPRILDLNAVVSGTIRMLERLIRENIRLVWGPAEDLWPVLADPSQIDQVLTNLALNGRDAIEGAGTIVIETANVRLGQAELKAEPDARPGDYVLLSVTDSGRGMSEDEKAHAFEPFFTTKGVAHGTGLGLATVFGIVKQNRGLIDVESEPGQGTRIRIHLPRVNAPAKATDPDSGQSLPRGSETVLLVEDEESILEPVRRLLTEHGYRVLAAGSPQSALALAGQPGNGIDLLVTDLVLPGMNGFDLHREVVALEPGVRCLCMSGYADGAVEAGAPDACRGEFLQKPFEAHVLLRKVRDVLDA